jgi:hypothetical protein
MQLLIKSYLGIIASKYAFEYTGDIKNLYKTEDLLTQSEEANKYSSSNHSFIRKKLYCKHRFKEALDLANKALAIGEGRKETQNYYLMSKWNWEILLRQK